MASNTLNFTINLNGNAYKGVLQLNDSIANVVKNVEEASSVFKQLGTSSIFLNNISDAVDKATGAFRSLVGTSLEFEQQQANLKTLLNGDAEATKNLVAQIREYGKATVYDRSSLIEAQKTMMAFGLNADFAFGKLKNIGDIALGDSAKMQSLALAFSQATSTGKLMGQDFLQMVNAGFNPLEVISQKTGKSMAELKDEMSKGQISADMLARSLEWATEEGGRFYQGAETAAQTTAGRIAKMKDTIDELKVSLFEATGGATAYIAEAGNLFSEITDIYGGFETIKEIGGVFKTVGADAIKNFGTLKTKIYNAYTTLGMYNGYLSVGKVQNLGFRKNVLQSAVALTRFATVGVFQALKGLGALLLSFVTTGATSVKFAGIASTSFATFKTSAVTACRAVGVAIKNIPIIGWVVAAIAALAAVGIYFWNTSAKFRAVLKGLWASFKVVFTGIGDMAKQVFGGIGDLIKAAFSLDGDGIKAALNKMKGGFADYGSQVGKAFNDAYNAEMAASKEEQKKKEKEDDVPAGIPQVEIPETPVTPDPTAGTLGTVGTAPASTSDKVKNVTVNVEKLVERFEIHTTNLQGDISRVKDMVSEALLSALNDVNLAM